MVASGRGLWVSTTTTMTAGLAASAAPKSRREEDGVAVSWAVNGNYGTLDASVSSRTAWEDVLDLVGPP